MDVDVEMRYSWDEGYVGWFDGGGICTPVVSGGHKVKLEPSIIDINGSYITFTIIVSLDDIIYKGMARFYVDAYGMVYET